MQENFQALSKLVEKIKVHYISDIHIFKDLIGNLYFL